MSDSNRASRLMSFASKAIPSFSHGTKASHQPLGSISQPPSILRRDPSIDQPYSAVQNQNDPFYSAHDDDMDDFLPQRPFVNEDGGPSSRRSSFSSDRKGGSRGGSPLPRPPSLSINYVPAKFTKLHAPGQNIQRRVNKVGGGRDAFARDAQRMGMMGTVDDDEGVAFQLGKDGLRKKKPKLRWNRFKWILFFSNSVLFAYGVAGLVCSVLVWLNIFFASAVIRTGNYVELVLSTVGASLCTFTALLGYSGIMLNNRAFLAVYTFLLWVCLAFICAPGYLSYKQKTFNLEGKINLQWSRNLGTEGRLNIQNALRCCGYYSPFVEATQSPLCYSRSIQPGCKNRYLHVERMVLTNWYTVAFSLVPAHILIIVAALLCSNHITYRFGKGLTPKRYRLDFDSMAMIMDNYANEIADKYGNETANFALSRSSSNLNVNEGSPRNSLSGSQHGSYSNLAALAPPSNNGNRPSSTLAPPGSTSYSSMTAPARRAGSNPPPGAYNAAPMSKITSAPGGPNGRTNTRPSKNPTGSRPYDPNRESFDASRPDTFHSFQNDNFGRSESSEFPKPGQFDDPYGMAR